jgi:hypothetical protein
MAGALVSPFSLEVPGWGPLSLAYPDVSKSLLLRALVAPVDTRGAIYSPNRKRSQALEPIRPSPRKAAGASDVRMPPQVVPASRPESG